MNKLIIILLAIVPLIGYSQSDWEVPTAKIISNKEANTEKTQKDKSQKSIDSKYLSGTVPLVENKVEFNYEIKSQEQSAQELYEKIYSVIENMTKEENQFKESRIVLINKKEHIIAARFREWLTFSSSFLSLDRTEFNYTLIAKCEDGKVILTLNKISYAYETNRGNEQGLVISAEKWITDKASLNKGGNNLKKGTSKFRIKTIDRKDDIFQHIKLSILK